MGGTTGGMFCLRPRGRVEVREVRKWGGMTLIDDVISRLPASGQLLDVPFFRLNDSLSEGHADPLAWGQSQSFSFGVSWYDMLPLMVLRRLGRENDVADFPLSLTNAVRKQGFRKHTRQT